MDFRELIEKLTAEEEYEITYRETTFFFTLRPMTNEQDQEYRRRSGAVSVKTKTLETADSALNAPLWLLEKVKVRVEVALPSSDESQAPIRVEVPPEVYKEIPATVRLAVVNAYLEQQRPTIEIVARTQSAPRSPLRPVAESE